MSEWSRSQVTTNAVLLVRRFGGWVRAYFLSHWMPLMSGRAVACLAAIVIAWPVAAQVIETFAGGSRPDTVARLAAIPIGVAVDGSGNVYIADTDSHRIRKVDSSGVITTFAGGGTDRIANGVSATSALLAEPSGVAVDGSGNVYIAAGRS